jgi:hypothetical protein
MVRSPIFQQALSVTTTPFRETNRTTLRAAQLTPIPYLIMARNDNSRDVNSAIASTPIFRELLRNVTSDLPIPYPGTGCRGRCLGHTKVSKKTLSKLSLPL